MLTRGFLAPPTLHAIRHRAIRKHVLTCNAYHKQILRIAIPSHPSASIPSASIVVSDALTNSIWTRARALDPVSAAIFFAGMLFGWLAARLANGRRQNATTAAASDPYPGNPPVVGSDRMTGMEIVGLAERIQWKNSGENAVWLNMSLRTLWRLFRKSTNALTRDVLQPVLDEMEFPDFVESVKITQLTLGESPALVREIQRLPTRSLNEIQYQFRLRLIGDKEGRIKIDVNIKVPGFSKPIVVPITVYALDIDSKVWLSLTVVPYNPWVRFAQWALAEMPSVKIKIQIADLLPVTTIPIFSRILTKILTEDIPREFLFPKTQLTDLMEEQINADVEDEPRRSAGVRDQKTEADVRDEFPDLAALFDTIDINDDGILGSNEISKGLVDWGYASESERSSISDLLDVNSDGFIGLREFVKSWPTLRNSFVPQRFWGVVSGVLLKAEDLRTPVLGTSDPYVVLRLERQMVSSKKNSVTSKNGRGNGVAFWNEGWELLVEKPRTAALRLEVREGCRLTYYNEVIPAPADPTTHSGTREVLAAATEEGIKRNDVLIGYGSIPLSSVLGVREGFWLDLSIGGGRVKLEMQVNQFVCV